MSAGTYDGNNCSSTVHLNADHPGTGKGVWSMSNPPEGASIVDPTAYNSDLKIPAGATVFLTWTYNMNEGDNCPDKSVGVKVVSHAVKAKASNGTFCDNYGNLIADAPSAANGEYGWWEAPAGVTFENNNSTLYNAKVYNLQEGGNNAFIWHLKNDYCEDRTTAYYTYLVPNAAISSNGPNGISQCEDHYTLTAVFDPTTNPDYVGEWRVVNGGANTFIDDPTNYRATVNNLQSGDNTVAWTVTYLPLSCSNTEEMHIFNKGVVLLDINDKYDCSDHGTISGNGPTTANGWQGKWSVHPNFVQSAQESGFKLENSDQITVTYSNLPTGSIVLRWRVDDPVTKCWNEKDVTVYNNEFIPSVNTDAINKCDEVITISGSLLDPNKDKGWWTVGESSPIVIYSPSSQITKLSHLVYGGNTIRWNVNHLGCIRHTDVSVPHYRFTNLNAGIDDETCEKVYRLNASDPFNIANVNASNIKTEWEVVTGGGKFTNSTACNSDVYDLNFGPNKLKWTVSNDYCPKMESFVIITNNRVEGDAGGKFVECSNDFEFLATMPAKYDSAWWSLGSGAGTFHEYSYKTISSDLFKFEPTNPESRWFGKSQAEFDAWYVNASNFTVDCNQTTVKNMNKGNNEYIWHISYKGCETQDIATVKNIKPTATVSQGGAICTTEATLRASKPTIGSGVWTKKTDHDDAIIVNSLSNITQVKELSQGEHTFIWTVTNVEDGITCTDAASVVINNQKITTYAGIDRKVCGDEAQPIHLSAQDPATQGEFVGTWYAEPGSTIKFANSTCYSTQVTGFTKKGANTLRWVIQSVDPNAKCQAEDEVVINFNKPTQPSLGVDYTSCTNTAPLNGTAPAPGEIGWWENPAGSSTITNTTEVYTTVTGLGNGENKFVWYIQRGKGDNACVASDEVIIYSRNLIINASPTEKEYCSDTAIVEGTVYGSNNYTSYWSTEAGGAKWLDNSTANNATAINLGSGKNILKWTVQVPPENGQDGCDFKTDVEVWNMTPEKANIVLSSLNVCDTKTPLTANKPLIAGESGHWTVIQGRGKFDNSLSNEVNVSDLSLDYNYITWTIERGKCQSVDTIVVRANSVTTSVSGDGDSDTLQVCQLEHNGEVTISATPANANIGGKGHWTTLSNGIEFIDDTSMANATIRVKNAGTHTLKWSIEENGCNAEAVLYVDAVQSTAEASMAGKNPVCNGQVSLIGNKPTNKDAITYWEYPSTAQVSSSTNNQTTMFVRAIGANTVFWTVESPRRHGLASCKSRAQVDVENYTVEALSGRDLVVCSTEESKQLVGNVPPEGGKGYWRLVNGSFTIENETSNITYISDVKQGVNTIKWVVESKPYNGDPNTVCKDSVEVHISNNQFVAYAGQEFEVCGSSTKLEAQLPDGAEGHWSGGNFVNEKDPFTIVSGLRPSVPTELIWSVTYNDCTSESKVVVTNVKVDTKILGGDRQICTDYIDLEALETPGQGLWSIPNGQGNYESDRTNRVIRITDLQPGPNTIRWEVTNGKMNCHTATQIVIDNKKLNIQAGTDFPTCDTFAYLHGTPLEPGQTGEWTWAGSTSSESFSGGDGPVFDNNSISNPEVSGLFYNDDGRGYANAFTWHIHDDNTGCDGYANVIVYCYNFTVDGDMLNEPNVQSTTSKNSPPVHGQPTKNDANGDAIYSVVWKPYIGSGTAQSPNDSVTIFESLSSGVNKFRYIATLNPNIIPGTHTKVPECKAESFVEIDYIAFKVNAGTDKAICVDSIQLHAERPIGAVGHWTSAERGCEFEDPTKPNTWVRKLHPGKNTLYWNVTRNGFTAIDSVSIYNYGFTVSAGFDQHLCEDSTVLHATGPLGNALIGDKWTGYWDTPFGSAKYMAASSVTTKVTELAAVTNVIVWHVTAWDDKVQAANTNGITCYAEDTVRVSYYVAPDAEFTVVPKTAAGCSPFTAEFANTTIDTDSTGSTFYIWNFGNITSVETTDHDDILERTFYNNSDHDSTLTIWLTTGIKIPGNQTCYNTDSSDITVFSVPTAKFTVSPQRQMQPSTQFSLYAVEVPGNNVRYAWAYGDGQGTVWNDNTEYAKTLTHKYAEFGEYKIVLDVKNKYCAASDTQVVIIDPAPPKRTMQSTGFEGCEPYLHELIEEVLYADSVRWDIYEVADTLKLNAQLMVAHDKLATYLFNKPGRYLLYQYAYGPGTDGELYMRTDTVTVFSTPVVEYEAYPDTVRLPNQALYTSNTSINGATYLWDFGDGETSVEKEPTHYYTQDGDFYVTLKVTSKEGCTTVGTETHVRVEPEGMLRFPTAFRPNTAGPNDGHEVKTHNWVFIPTPRTGIKAGTYKLQIFNRYGEKIFESTDPEIGWNGYYRGSLCNQDVYVWKCNCIFENGKIYKKIGNVTLLR
ncbi:MAG: PKD domain-containing protein [Bacteroidales bacterium]|nr:PKD domain-containing protein [Bacteroidales bacterium]